jgi:RND family efflux transporter MFP subunit
MTCVRLALLLAILMAFLPACGEHGHPHDDASDHQAADERPTVALSRWTDRTELFMEYPVFVAGESGRSAIHVTDLADFSPLNAGEAIVSLRASDGRILEFRGGPSRPGIFGVDLAVDQPGIYEMTLRVDAPGLQDLHELGPVTVHAAGSSPDGGDEEQGEAISFLKEQQWILTFGTEPVQVRRLQSSIRVPAAIRPRAGGEAILSAAVPGRIDPASSTPIPGTRVRAGALLVRIVPRSDDVRDAAGLRAALVEAEQQWELAVGERERAARLVESRALPARRLSEAQAAVTVSNARLEAARQRWARFESLSHSGGSGVPDSGFFEVHAPFDGIVADVRFAPGASVEQDEFLVRLVDADRVHVVGAVPEAQASKLGLVDSGELLRDGMSPIPLGKPLAVGSVVEPDARTVDVRFALDNRELGLHVGHSVGLRLFLSDAESQPAAPESAIVDDGGQPVVFVQTGGESFERRPVTLGNRAAGYVHILEGVAPGERVVHRGAYFIRLAAMSTQIPAHGHVH